METEDLVIFTIFIGLMLIKPAQIFSEYLQGLMAKIFSFQPFVLSAIHSWQFNFLLALIALLFLSYLNYKICDWILQILEDRRDEKQRIKDEFEEIENAVHVDLEELNIPEMEEHIELLEEKISIAQESSKLSSFEKPLRERLVDAERLLEELEHKANIDNLEERGQRLRAENMEADRQLQAKLRKEDAKREFILNDLDARNNKVFKKEDITTDEINALLGDEYYHANEYCISEQQLISVLVKQVLNHSLTHTFLVWSTKRFLENHKGISEIDEHLTKEADLTFKYKGKEFALEIETGSLLRKKEQAGDKIKYLNRKYGNRWMIIVSNKNLLPRYRRFGPATQRKDVAKNLEKLLKMA